LSSLSHPDQCTKNENTYYPESTEAHFVFDNASDHAVYPSFGEEADTINGWLKPGSIRIYQLGADTARNEKHTAVKDPYLHSYVDCIKGSDLISPKRRQVTYRKTVGGQYECVSIRLYPACKYDSDCERFSGFCGDGFCREQWYGVGVNTKSLKAANRALKEAFNAALN